MSAQKYISTCCIATATLRRKTYSILESWEVTTKQERPVARCSLQQILTSRQSFQHCICLACLSMKSLPFRFLTVSGDSG